MTIFLLFLKIIFFHTFIKVFLKFIINIFTNFLLVMNKIYFFFSKKFISTYYIKILKINFNEFTGQVLIFLLSMNLENYNLSLTAFITIFINLILGFFKFFFFLNILK